MVENFVTGPHACIKQKCSFVALIASDLMGTVNMVQECITGVRF